MKKEVKYLTATSLCVLLLLMVSGVFEGIMQTIIYNIAFIIPFFLCLYLYFGGQKKKEIFTSDYLKIDKKGAFIASATIFPTVLLVMGISLAFTLLFALFGKEKITVINEPPLVAVLSHALLPAFFEEAVFRYLPLRLMGRRSPRGTVFVSAILFALLHHSLFSIPHAFIAGVCFMTVDLLCESVFPSFAIHFINNLFALLCMGALGFKIELYLVFLILGGLAVLSLIPLFLLRSEIAGRCKKLFTWGEKMPFPIELFYLAVPSLLIAFMEIWG